MEEQIELPAREDLEEWPQPRCEWPGSLRSIMLRGGVFQSEAGQWRGSSALQREKVGKEEK